MLVMILEKTPTSLKGELSRWLIEPKSGVFLGNPTARVRDALWEMAVAKARGGSVTQIWSYPCAQGYRYRQAGAPSRMLMDFEGLALVYTPERKAETTAPAHRKVGEPDENCGQDGLP